jgi:hypothetical protein
VGVKPNTWKKWGFGVLRDSQMFRVRQQGPKHLELRCSWCHWKGLEAQISKMASHWPFGHLQPKLWAKKGPLKVGNRPLPDLRIESAIRRWKDLAEGYKFGLVHVAIRFCNWELWAPKVPGLHPGQFRDNFGTPTRESRESREKVTFGRGCRGVSQSIL